MDVTIDTNITKRKESHMETYQKYAVTAMNMDTRKVFCDCFTELNEAEATKSFRECYRNAEYKILSVVLVPEE